MIIMNEEKLVSVIIPTYKRPDTLLRTIQSVLNQTYKNIEIIIVDDNAPDSIDRKYTESMMEKFKYHENVKYIKHEYNKNGSAARNTGFKNSNGQYIMFLDDDDEFLPRKVSSQVERMDSLDETWGACYTKYIRKKNGVTVVYGAENREGKLLKQELMRNLFIHAGSNLMVRRSIVEELNGFDETFSRNQDVEFLSRLLMKYKLAFVNELGLIVHVHEKVLTNISFEQITQDYIKKFSQVIDQFDEKDKNEIYMMINLQLFRHYITSKGKRMKAIRQLINNEITLNTAIKYIRHLIFRKINKKAYGFKI